MAGVLLVVYWYRKRLPAANAAAPKAAASGTTELAADMRELAERLADDLDSKADRLETLLAQAEVRIQQLERLAAVPVREPAGLVEPRQSYVQSPRTRGESAELSHREVYELADSGLSPVEIAKRLERPTGQVELILNLRRGSVAL
jgi:hypothetical protein